MVLVWHRGLYIVRIERLVTGQLYLCQEIVCVIKSRVTCLESMNLSNALSSPWVGHRLMGTQNPLYPIVASSRRSAGVQVLRHRRPSLRTNRESSRIIVAECFGWTWIARNRRCSTASQSRIRETAIVQ